MLRIVAVAALVLACSSPGIAAAPPANTQPAATGTMYNGNNTKPLVALPNPEAKKPTATNNGANSAATGTGTGGSSGGAPSGGAEN